MTRRGGQEIRSPRPPWMWPTPLTAATRCPATRIRSAISSH